MEKLKDSLTKIANTLPGLSIRVEEYANDDFLPRMEVIIRILPLGMADNKCRGFYHRQAFSTFEVKQIESDDLFTSMVVHNLISRVYLEYAEAILAADDSDFADVGDELAATHKDFAAASDYALKYKPMAVIPAARLTAEIKKRYALADELDALRPKVKALTAENTSLKYELLATRVFLPLSFTNK